MSDDYYWVYANGEKRLAESTHPLADEALAEIKDYDKQIEAAGYEAVERFGGGYPSVVASELYRREQPGEYQYLVDIWGVNFGLVGIYCASRMDAVEILAKIAAPLAAVWGIQSLAEDMEPVRVAAEDTDAYQRLNARKRQNARRAASAPAPGRKS